MEPAIPSRVPLPTLYALLLAACTAPPAGPVPSGSLRFDGVDDHAVLEDMPDVPAEGWTVEAWIKPVHSAQPKPNIVARRAPRGGTDSFTFRIRRDFGGVLELGIASAGGTWGMAGQAPIPEDRWSHVAASWDRSEHRMRLFVDGQLDAERDCPIEPGRGTAPLWLGGDPLHGPEGRPFAGWISELRIWDHTRDAAQLSAARDHPLTGQEPGLILYWPAGDGQGSRVTDRGPRGLHGTRQAGYEPAWDGATPF
jgi:hypothetical protein